MTEKKIPKKRGRKPKKKNPNEPPVVKVPKKRGRKPKGGKIMSNIITTNKIVSVMPNIILHLCCNMDDVNKSFNITNSYNPDVINIETYDDYNNDYFKTGYSLVTNNIKEEDKVDKEKIINIESLYKDTQINIVNNDIKEINEVKEIIDNDYYKNQSTLYNNKEITNKEIDMNEKPNQKNISKKLKDLSYKLHNNISENKSACFWCTCRYNTGNIYIPKNIEEDNIDVYGSFCSPQCATSYLMNEHIDSSIKFERYSLLNYVYGAIYNYEKNIKPAPSPYYTLDKFCGNMTIEEYRSHFTDDNLLIIANKPQTRIYPELFEENSMSNNDMRYSINKYS